MVLKILKIVFDQGIKGLIYCFHLLCLQNMSLKFYFSISQITALLIYLLDTEHKLNVQKTFKRCLLIVLCTFNLCSISERVNQSYCWFLQLFPNFLQLTAHFWKAWHDFEVKHGNEDTFREMLRIKRSVQAQYNTQVCLLCHLRKVEK